MYISEKGDWIRYSSEDDWKLSSIKDCGKWVNFYREIEFAKQVITRAIDLDIVKYAKHTKGNSGALCLYVSATNVNDHMRVINFLKDQNLIRLKSDLSYFDNSFKLNGQSWSKEYGNFFEGLIKLSDFIDLNTGIPLASNNLNNPLVISQFNQSSIIANSTYLNPLTDTIKQLVLRKINKVLTHKPEQTDLNDKIVHLAPFCYNVTTLFKQKSEHGFLSLCARLIYIGTNRANPKQKANIAKIRNYNNSDVTKLFELFNTHDTDNIDSVLTKFISLYNHCDLSDEILNSIAYLILIGLSNISKSEIEQIQYN